MSPPVPDTVLPSTGSATGPLRRSQRLLTALLGLLALVGVLTGVSLHRASQLDEALSRLDDSAWPSVRAVHGLALLVDEARGMEALHLLLDSEAERREVETRLARQRSRIAERLAAQASRTSDAAERRHLAEVNGAAAAWWGVQDRVLAASRAAPADAVQAQRARTLMTGESQAAYRQLLDALEAWWQHHDQQAQFPPSKAWGGALQGLRGLHLLNGLALLLGVAALALAGVAWRSLREAGADRHGAARAAAGPPAGDRHAEAAAALLDQLAQRPRPEAADPVAPPRSKDLA